MLFCVESLTITAAEANVTISSAQTQDMSCSDGVCAPTAAAATLNATDLENLLASGDVEVTTTGSGVQAGNVVVTAALAWSNTSALGLDAYQSITINKMVSVNGHGSLSLMTNDGGSGGAFSFGQRGHVIFDSLSSPLIINGTTYTLINSVQSLASAVAANPGGAFALASSYNASQDGTYSAAPVQTGLTGSFEGLGNSISHLSINGSGYIGLFSVAVGVIENLDLLDVNLVVSGGSRAGALAGDTSDTGVALRVYASGTIRGTGSVQNIIGGLASAGGSFINCSTNMQIVDKGPGAAAGLVAEVESGSIGESFAMGSVAATGQRSVTGGLAALNLGKIQNSYATTALTGGAQSQVGGLVGTNGDANDPPGTIETSYSTGAVAGGKRSNVGGFAGIAYKARKYDAIRQSYWDTTTSGTDRGTGKGDRKGIAGLTTEQLQSGLPDGFDPKIWAENPKINNGLPYLINNPPEK
jgi:hypothetical protein